LTHLAIPLAPLPVRVRASLLSLMPSSTRTMSYLRVHSSLKRHSSEETVTTKLVG
jgi:hypothetical protein